MIRLRRLAQLALIATCSAVMSCASDATPDEIQSLVNSVQLALGLSTLTVGQTVQASAIAMSASGGALSGQSIVWSTSNAAVASVTSAGLVTAVSPGTATITAAAAGKTASATVTVVSGVVPVAAVSVALSASTVGVGQPVTATATTRDAGNNVLTGRTITWSSSNSAVATVSSSGAVTALAAGTTSIIAASEGVTGSATLSVQAPVASVSVGLASPSLTPGQQTTAIATLRDAGNNLLSGRAVTWNSSNITVATVTSAGVVTAVAAGTATISATSEGITGSTGITVQSVVAPVAAVSVSIVDNPIGVTKSTTATATTRDVNGNVLVGRSIAWSSSNSAIATVSTTGAVTGVSAGSVSITATSEGISGSASITVQASAAVVTVSLGAPSVRVGTTTSATALVLDANNNVLSGHPISWTSSNAAVATVTPTGLVAGVTTGTAGITATVDGVSGSTTVTIVPATGGTVATPTQLAITTQPGNAFSGVNFPVPAVIEVRDVNNVLVPGTNNLVTASVASGTGTIAGAFSVAAINGVATFTNLKVNGVGPQTLTFAATGLTSVTSNSFTLTQLPGSLSLQQQPSGAVTGVTFVNQPIVRILDVGGVLINTSTLAVTAAITAGAGTLVGTTTVNAVGGVATFTNLKINGTGPFVLSFTTAGPALQVLSTQFAVAQGPATQVAITSQPSNVVSGLAFAPQPVVEIRDATNALEVGATNQVTVALASGTGTLVGTTTVNAVNGVASFTNLKINGTGAHTLAFTSAGLTAATSGTITVTQTAATLLVLAQPGGAVSGQPFGGQPVIQILDNAGLVATNLTSAVTATLTAGTGTLGGTTTVNAVAGVATFTNLQVTGTGNAALTFSTTSPSLQVSSSTFNVAASQSGGGATQLAITNAPTAATSGVNLSPQLVIEVRDAGGNRVTTSTASVTVAIATGTGQLVGTTSVNAVNGTVTFAGLKLNGTGNHTLIFSSAGLTSATTGTITLTQTPATLSIFTQPAQATTGSQLLTQPVVRILDNAGLLIANSTLAVTATRTTGTAALLGTTTVNAVAGVATFTNLRLDGTGSNALTFSTVAPALQVVSSPFNVAVGPATQLAIATQPGGAGTGLAFSTQPVIQVQDVGGNVVPTSTALITVSVASGPGALSGTLQLNAVSGVATFTNLVLNAAGNYTLNFASAGFTTVVSNTVNVVSPGTFSGSVATVGAAPVGGGSVEVLQGNTIIRTVTIAGNGTFTTSLSPGNYSAKLHPPFAFSLGPAEPDTRSITITGGNTTTQPFVVQSAVYADDFQSYTSQTQLVNTQDHPFPPGTFFSSVTNGEISSVSQPQNIFLDLTGGPGGSKAMRYDWPNGFNGGTIQVSPRINPPAVTTSLAVRWTDMVSPLFTNGGAAFVGSSREYKYFLIKLGPPVAGTLSQIGVYLEGSEPLYRITMDVTDRTNNINTTHATFFPLPLNWRSNWHNWVLTATGLGSANATFVLYYDDQAVITLNGPFLPALGSIGGPGQLLVLEPGSNINNGPDVLQSRWWREFAVYYTRPSLRP